MLITNQMIIDYEDLVQLIVQQHHGYHVVEEDLMQEGRIGLLEAYRHYDTRRQVRFDSYASWWIRFYIRKAIHAYGYPVSIPRNIPLPEECEVVNFEEYFNEDDPEEDNYD